MRCRGLLNHVRVLLVAVLVPVVIALPLLDVDVRGLRNRIAQFVRTGELAAQGSANANVRLAGRVPAEHRIKRDELENVDRLKIEPGGDPLDRFIRDVPELLLPEVEQGKRGGSLARRVVRNGFVDLREEFSWNVEKH